MQKQPTIDTIFMGTAEFGVPLLRALHADDRFAIPLAVTQEDRPAGRDLKPAPSPVKQAAQELGLKLFQPKNINAPDSVETIRALHPDMIIVAAYGQILKKPLLDLPSFGCINVHGSLLPKYRGASPIQSAILAGETETGISVMLMEERLDSGPVFARFPIPIEPEDNAVVLHDKLAAIAADRVPEILFKIFLKRIKPEIQDVSKATLCQKLTRETGLIDWSEDAETIARKIRAFAGWPGTYTFWDKKLLKILDGSACSRYASAGQAAITNGLISVGAGEGSVEIKSVQLEGKKAQTAAEFVRGHPDFIGAVLGK